MIDEVIIDSGIGSSSHRVNVDSLSH